MARPESRPEHPTHSPTGFVQEIINRDKSAADAIQKNIERERGRVLPTVEDVIVVAKTAAGTVGIISSLYLRDLPNTLPRAIRARLPRRRR